MTKVAVLALSLHNLGVTVSSSCNLVEDVGGYDAVLDLAGQLGVPIVLGKSQIQTTNLIIERSHA